MRFTISEFEQIKKEFIEEYPGYIIGLCYLRRVWDKKRFYLKRGETLGNFCILVMFENEVPGELPFGKFFKSKKSNKAFRVFTEGNYDPKFLHHFDPLTRTHRTDA